MPCISEPYESESYQPIGVLRIARERAERERHISEELKKIDFLEAALCAALRGLEYESGNKMYLRIDFKEAGIEQTKLMDWYKVHKKKDAKRLEREKKQRLKKSALEKVNKLLTSEERKSLGLK